ncbi:hypothetical protein BDV26DRAFT_145446 [Aspergillus bertholletiae]|uniref:Uncharacterized protein n=1 Tax=Aspergillus bertholletiae TaxID=1226010 RepID=A0A5N7BEK0_9EURO|nr:hypothetical protein BDV26DRAFT_145446 [Aspergillus bertholletiae]
MDYSAKWLCLYSTKGMFKDKDCPHVSFCRREYTDICSSPCKDFPITFTTAYGSLLYMLNLCREYCTLPDNSLQRFSCRPNLVLGFSRSLNSLIMSLLTILNRRRRSPPNYMKRICIVLLTSLVSYFVFLSALNSGRKIALPLRLIRRRSINAAIWFGLCLRDTFFVRNFNIDWTLHLAGQA